MAGLQPSEPGEIQATFCSGCAEIAGGGNLPMGCGEMGSVEFPNRLFGNSHMPPRRGSMIWVMRTIKIPSLAAR
jgi:hypothetical protein